MLLLPEGGSSTRRQRQTAKNCQLRFFCLQDAISVTPHAGVQVLSISSNENIYSSLDRQLPVPLQ